MNKRNVSGKYMEDLARFLVRELRSKFEGSKWTCNLIPTSMEEVYDVRMDMYDRVSNELHHTFLIEVKIRYDDYPTIVLEKKKVDSISRLISDSKTSMIYLSVHPSGSYLFNISKMDISFKEWTGTKKSTYFHNNNQDAGTKLAAFLHKDEARFIDITTNKIFDLYESYIKNK